MERPELLLALYGLPRRYQTAVVVTRAPISVFFECVPCRPNAVSEEQIQWLRRRTGSTCNWMPVFGPSYKFSSLSGEFFLRLYLLMNFASLTTFEPPGFFDHFEPPGFFDHF